MIRGATKFLLKSYWARKYLALWFPGRRNTFWKIFLGDEIFFEKFVKSSGSPSNILMYTTHIKFLKIIWKNQLYKFLELLNGLCCSPRKFTKLMKPPIATLRLYGHIIAIYIDDLINLGLRFDECLKNVITSMKLLNSLGFIIHPEKSIFLQKQEITF